MVFTWRKDPTPHYFFLFPGCLCSMISIYILCSTWSSFRIWAFPHVRHPQTPGTRTFWAASRYNISLKQDFEANSIKSKFKKMHIHLLFSELRLRWPPSFGLFEISRKQWKLRYQMNWCSRDFWSINVFGNACMPCKCCFQCCFWCILVYLLENRLKMIEARIEVDKPCSR